MLVSAVALLVAFLCALQVAGVFFKLLFLTAVFVVAIATVGAFRAAQR